MSPLEPPLRVLLVEDEPFQRKLVTVLLEGEGFEVAPFEEAESALASFEAVAPDLVLADYELPGATGLELGRRLRASGRFLPMVMFTGGSRSGLLREAMDAGFIEFLTKPVEPEELRCRVRSLGDQIRLHRRLEGRLEAEEEELALVKHMLERLVAPGLGALPPSMVMETRPTRRINGDACAYAEPIPALHFGLLCDATGHGLMAGVSTVPVVEAFLSMARRDMPLDAIYAEADLKLHRLLPTGRFACAALVRLDAARGTLGVLNAGMPEVWLLQADGDRRAFASRAMPIGVFPGDRPAAVEEVAVRPGDRVFACSDGFLEVVPPDRLRDELLEPGGMLPLEAHRELIRLRLDEGIRDAAGEAGAEVLDDVSWMLWEVPGPPGPAAAHRPGAPEGPLQARVEVLFAFDPRELAVKVLLPQILTFLSGQGFGQGDLQVLALLLSETLANAVDHGVLGLDSGLKAQGFEAYEAARQARLLAREPGRVEVRLRLLHRVEDGRPGRLEVRVEDSGPGFDWRNWTAPEGAPSGRGLALVRALAAEVDFSEAGNAIGFTWTCDARRSEP